ncbi:MAG: response regulator [Sneathiella sp.]
MAHVLIVDNNQKTRSELHNGLRKLNFLVDSVGTAQEAERKIGKIPPDIIFTDILLYDQDGLEFISRLRTGHESIPIISMLDAKSHSKAAIKDYSLKRGASASLEKPWNANEVFSVLQQIFKAAEQKN